MNEEKLSEEKKILNRKMYKVVKKMDRQQMESFLSDIYKSGFHDGAEVGTKVDFKIELIQFLEGLEVKGIGGKTKEKILQAYKERGNE